MTFIPNELANNCIINVIAGQRVMTHSVNCILLTLIRISSVLNISFFAIINTLDIMHL